ncbi:MAG: hypothetical protein ACR2LC_07140 [Pyrinomonadaceae bacterium]
MKRFTFFSIVAVLTFTIGVLFASIHFLRAYKPTTLISEPHFSQSAAESNDADIQLADVFYDFDLVGSSPINYKYIPSSHHSFVLSEKVPLPESKVLRPFPQKLEFGQRYIILNRNSEFDDPFYQILERRFHAIGVETSIFIPSSFMAIATKPTIPARFIDKPLAVMQPMSLVVHGKGYEGLVIRDEYNQTLIDRKPKVKSVIHDYSLILLKETP